MITINQIKKLPKYIMVLNTEMRLVNNQISHKEDRIYELDELCDISYYRDAGDWYVDVKIDGDKIIVDTSTSTLDHLYNLEVTEITEEDWRKSNTYHITEDTKAFDINDFLSNDTIWGEIINIVNKMPINGILTRQNLLNILAQKGIEWSPTIDTYRRYLTAANFLSETNKRGYYEKKSDIPDNYSINDCKTKAYKL